MMMRRREASDTSGLLESADRAINGALTKNPCADIDNSALPWRHTKKWFVEADNQLPCLHSCTGENRVSVRSHLNVAGERLTPKTVLIASIFRKARAHRIRPREAHHRTGQLADRESFFGSDDHLVGFRSHFQDIARLAIRRWIPQLKTFPLTHGVGVGALVRAHHLALGGQNLPLLLPHTLGEPPAGVAIRDKANVVAVGFVGNNEAALRRLS